MIRITNEETFKRWMRYEMCDYIAEADGKEVKLPEIMGEWEGFGANYYFDIGEYRDDAFLLTGGNEDASFSEIMDGLIKWARKDGIGTTSVFGKAAEDLVTWANDNGVDVGAEFVDFDDKPVKPVKVAKPSTVTLTEKQKKKLAKMRKKVLDALAEARECAKARNMDVWMILNQHNQLQVYVDCITLGKKKHERLMIATATNTIQGGEAVIDAVQYWFQFGKYAKA